MPETIDAARGLLEARLAEIETEATQLRAALSNLGAGSSGARSSAARSKTKLRGGRKSSKRAPRGQRRREFVAAVQKSPGATASEIAKQIGISTNQAYGLAQRLVKEGDIRKKGKGYRPS